ncbi:hypothetical protein QTP70_000372 [Hemibagrus guttatus]|uniref:ribonuclease H n=1 Tax=Hemibagrus guttatus TaxID=175788 RepID=A0AAE0PT93_9TELE|nr:hypothetical protein QTP70_000372 [Hemibagrus guttatus]
MEKDYRTTSGKFWQTVRRLRRGKQLSANTVYGGDGELLVSTGDIVGRWKEYFEDLLNPTDTPSVEELEAEDSEVDSFITQAEVTKVVQQLLGGKAPGVDEIRPEYLKSLDVVGLSWLTRLCNIAWRSGTVPLDWATRVVDPLFKKGDRRLYTLHRVLEGSWEFAQPVHICFVDLEKAFDRVPPGILWEVLWEYGVRGPLLRAVRSLDNRSRSLVRIASCKSDLFPVHVRLRQGCPLSPVLFIVFMDRISRRSQGLEGVWFGDHRISSLIFADDVVLLASSGLDLQGRFAAECEAAGMRVSTSKSEAMVLNQKKVACTLQVGEEVLPQVEEFKYLGVLFTSEGRMDREIDRRIGAAAAVMRSMYRSVVVKKELSRKAKLSIYQSIYAPTLTYGHELWVMTERTEEFNVEVGLHQGSALSPFLFAIVMDQLSEDVRQESPWTMMFADDIVICSESREQVEESLERWRFALERRGMKFTHSKTEYMCVNEREGSGTVRLQGEEVKKVQEFKYLGSTVQSNGECGKEVKKRVQAGWNGWRKVLGVLSDRKI